MVYQCSIQKIVLFVDTMSRRKQFWDTAVPCRSENSHNVVHFNPNEDKYYLLTPYSTLISPLKNFHLRVCAQLLVIQT